MCKLSYEEEPPPGAGSIVPVSRILAMSVSPPGKAENPALELTKRQRKVAELVLRGMTNREIGKELYISEQTVKRHLYNIYTRLGVKNRVQLLRKLSGFQI